MTPSLGKSEIDSGAGLSELWFSKKDFFGKN
jgi:hypothetical protein